MVRVGREGGPRDGEGETERGVWKREVEKDGDESGVELTLQLNGTPKSWAAESPASARAARHERRENILMASKERRGPEQRTTRFANGQGKTKPSRSAGTLRVTACYIRVLDHETRPAALGTCLGTWVLPLTGVDRPSLACAGPHY